MAKSINDNVLDAALGYIKTATQITVCSTNQPTTFAQATSTNNYMLATTTLTTADYSIANGDLSGRKITVAQQTNERAEYLPENPAVVFPKIGDGFVARALPRCEPKRFEVQPGFALKFA